MTDPQEAFVAALRGLTLRWRARFDTDLRAVGQTLPRADALMALSRAPGGMSQRELAAHLSLEHPTLVRILDGLEAQGLIRRLPVEGDRRANRVVLTEAAGPVLERVRALSAAQRRRVLGEVEPEALRRATELLRDLRARVEADAAEAAR